MANKKEANKDEEDGRTSSRWRLMMTSTLAKAIETLADLFEILEVLFVLCQARYQGIVVETCLLNADRDNKKNK